MGCMHHLGASKVYFFFLPLLLSPPGGKADKQSKGRGESNSLKREAGICMVISQIRYRKAFYFIFLIEDPLSVSKSEYPDSKDLLNITFCCLYQKRMFSRGK